MLHRLIWLFTSISAMAAVSCALPMQQATVSGPMFVPTANQEVLWERAVDVLHDYQFEVARENQFDHFIETGYKTGSGFLEPWHRDSVGSENLAESTFQSIRRKVIVRIIPSDGGHLVAVEAFKEIEDVQGAVANTAGGATFEDANPFRRDLNLVVGQSAPSGWIPQGHDAALEQSILASLNTAFSR